MPLELGDAGLADAVEQGTGNREQGTGKTKLQ
jgi:hypothetical protein